MKTICIIGGGFCGMMTAVQLVQQARCALKILLINPKTEIGKGIAYQPASAQFLLNVMAEKMSAFPDLPLDFLNWASQQARYRSIEPNLLSKAYLPRYLYGQYLQEIWNKTLNTSNALVELRQLVGTATDIELNSKNTYIIKGIGFSPQTADAVVLATGNALPRNPKIADMTYYEHPTYFQNPWDKTTFENIHKEQDILLIGNGLTMVDTVLGLIEKGHKATIYSLSPHGYGILPHRHNGVVYTGLDAHLKTSHSLHEWMTLLHQHIRKVRSIGLSSEPIVDAMRPYAQRIWQEFSGAEKRVFLQRFRHLWGVARHRLPLHLHDRLQQLRIEGRLKILAGKIQTIKAISSQDVLANFYSHTTHQVEELRISRVINCTGPESDIRFSNNELLRNLYQNKMLHPDPLRLGVLASPKGEILNEKGEIIPNLYTLGNLLRATLWESTAIPELRLQAQQIATLCLSE